MAHAPWLWLPMSAVRTMVAATALCRFPSCGIRCSRRWPPRWSPRFFRLGRCERLGVDRLPLRRGGRTGAEFKELGMDGSQPVEKLGKRMLDGLMPGLASGRKGWHGEADTAASAVL